MTAKVVFRRAAQAELDAAALWYEERLPGLGSQFLTEIDRIVHLVAEHPEHFPIKHREIRCALAFRFPYSIFFRVETHRIVVLAVFHAKRDPKIWQTRT